MVSLSKKNKIFSFHIITISTIFVIIILFSHLSQEHLFYNFPKSKVSLIKICLFSSKNNDWKSVACIIRPALQSNQRFPSNSTPCIHHQNCLKTCTLLLHTHQLTPNIHFPFIHPFIYSSHDYTQSFLFYHFRIIFHSLPWNISNILF